MFLKKGPSSQQALLISKPRGKARQYASDVDEWGAGALWGVRLRGGKRGDVLPVHLECWVPRFPFWREYNKCRFE